MTGWGSDKVAYEMETEEMEEFSIIPIERIVYIWSRYEGRRDSSKEGKHYSKSDLKELVRRLERFIENPDSFNEGFEKECQDEPKLEDCETEVKK